MDYLLIIAALILLYLIIDYRNPKRIVFQNIKEFGLRGLVAKDLIVQQFDDKGNLWASRGYTIYRLKNGDKVFKRMIRIPVSLSFYWLFNFAFFRKLVNQSECMEFVVSEKGEVCACAAGNMYHGNIYLKKIKKSMRLPHFGFGVGRGILSNGLLQVDENKIYIGEYFRNSERVGVKIFMSSDFGKKWKVVYEFSPGEIRHIHSLQKDPYAGKLWVCVGDSDEESKIGWSTDEFKTIHFIGQGSQKWRTCQLAFTSESVIWGTDTGSDSHAGIYSWNRVQNRVECLTKIQGAVFFASQLDDETIVMSTDREGFLNEKDDYTRLLIIDDQKVVSEIKCGLWDQTNSGIRFGYAKTRLQRNIGGDSLAMNFINQHEISNGDLVIVSKEELLQSAKCIEEVDDDIELTSQMQQVAM